MEVRERLYVKQAHTKVLTLNINEIILYVAKLYKSIHAKSQKQH